MKSLETTKYFIEQYTMVILNLSFSVGCKSEKRREVLSDSDGD